MIGIYSAVILAQEPGLGETLGPVVDAVQSHGWLGGLSALLTVGVQLWKLPAIQQFLPERVQWQNLAKGARRLTAFGLAFLGSLIMLTLILGSGLVPSIISSIAVGLGAIGLKTGATIGKKSEPLPDPGQLPEQ